MNNLVWPCFANRHNIGRQFVVRKANREISVALTKRKRGNVCVRVQRACISVMSVPVPLLESFSQLQEVEISLVHFY